MLPTRTVRPSGAKATPCDQWPMGASATRDSALPVTRTSTSLPPALKKGESLARLLPLWTTTATTELSGEIFRPSAVAPSTPIVSTTRGGFAARSMRLMLSLSPVAPPARLATTAKAPFDATSSTMGRTPAVMSRLAYSTFAPSIDSTEILLSLLRETSAVLPSGVIATIPPPAALPPTSTVPAGVTVLPWIVKTDTVPSTRFETSASVPARLIEMPAAPLPASSRASTVGGFALMSITVTWLFGACFLGSAGSTLLDAVTIARPSSGVTATLSGGPTTLTGAGTSPTTRGGEALRSMTDTVSDGGFGTTVTTPLTSSTLLSLAETAICAPAGAAAPTTRSASETAVSRRSVMGAPS